jgi:hypothetical protein
VSAKEAPAPGDRLEQLTDDFSFLRRECFDRVVAGDLIDVGLCVRREFVVHRTAADHRFGPAIASRATSIAVLLS